MDYKEKLKEALNSDNTDYEVVRWIEQNFPELKESEDERIRKQLIEHTKWSYDEQEISEEEKERWISWLEKQGEHKKFRDSIQIGDKVTKNEDGVLVNLSQLKRVAKKDEKQGEQKPAEDSQKVSEPSTEEKDMTEYKKGFECGKQRVLKYPEDFGLCKKTLTAWSEEDERYLNIVSSVIRSPSVQGIYDYHKVNSTDVSGWLKSLKDRVQPQNRWKPDKAVIQILELIIQGKANPTNYQATLMNLVEQLKKLKY